MLRWRFVTAPLLAPVVLGAIMLGRWAIVAVIIVVVALAAYELARALKPFPFAAAFGAGGLPVLFSIPYSASGALAGAVLSLPWALFWLTSRSDARTLRAVLALVAVTGPWISDSGAYFAGHFFGRHPLFPALSPKKTVEGAIGGLLVTMAAVGYFAQGFLGLG